MLKEIRGSPLQPSCARQHSPRIPSYPKAASDLQLTFASEKRALTTHARPRQEHRASEVHKSRMPTSERGFVSLGLRAKPLAFPTGMVSHPNSP